MASIIGGIVALGLGIWGLVSWWWDFVLVLRGAVPFVIVLGGIVAITAGISSMRDRRAAKKEEEKQEEVSKTEQQEGESSK